MPVKKRKTTARKPAAKKTTARKPAVKKTAKPKTKRKVSANSAFMKPLSLSSELQAIVGKGPMPRTEVVKKLWAYIKRNKLQDAKNKRNINADDKLAPIFRKKTVSMFEMTKLISKHVK